MKKKIKIKDKNIKDKLNLFKEIRKLQQRIIMAINLYGKINNKLSELTEIKHEKKN